MLITCPAPSSSEISYIDRSKENWATVERQYDYVKLIRESYLPLMFSMLMLEDWTGPSIASTTFVDTSIDIDRVSRVASTVLSVKASTVKLSFLLVELRNIVEGSGTPTLTSRL